MWARRAVITPACDIHDDDDDDDDFDNLYVPSEIFKS